MLMDIGHASGLALTGTLLVFLDGNYNSTFLIVGMLVLLSAVIFLFFVRAPLPQDSA
jgi:hypothetical protein